MKRFNRLLPLCGLLASALFLASSCIIFDFVFNHPPTVVLSASDISVRAGETVILNALASDEDGDTLTYTWFVGAVEQTEATDSTIDFETSSYTEDTTVTISVTVDDGREYNATASTNIYISVAANRSPSLTLAASSQNVVSGTVVTLTATAVDPDGDTLGYSWTVNGTAQPSATSSTFSLATSGYTSDTVVTVAARVSDGYGGTATDSIDITVNANRSPTVSLSADQTNVSAGTTVNLSAAASDPDGDTLQYSWTVNGVTVPDITAATVTYNTSGFTADAMVTIAVTVNDGNGGTATDSVVITITTNAAPTVSLSANDSSAYSDQNITFTASASDPNGDTISYSWYVDGSLQSNTTASVTWYWLNTSTLSPTIKVRATDSHGAWSEDSVGITVTPAASVRYINRTGASLWYLYCKYHTSSTWGSDLLGSSNVLYDGYLFTLYGITATSYTYDFKAVNSSGTYWATSDGYALLKGYYRNFWVYSSYWYLEGNSQASSNMTAGEQGMAVRGITPYAQSKDDKMSVAGISIRPISNLDKEARQRSDQPFTVVQQ